MVASPVGRRSHPHLTLVASCRLGGNWSLASPRRRRVHPTTDREVTDLLSVDDGPVPAGLALILGSIEPGEVCQRARGTLPEIVPGRKERLTGGSARG